MTIDTQRPTRRSLIIQCLASRIWEASPEAIARILNKLPDELVETIAATTVEVLKTGGSNETND